MALGGRESDQILCDSSHTIAKSGHTIYYQVNLSPSLNCDAPIDMKIKSAMICDLLNLIGLPAVDPVLKRAQFNKKVSSIKTLWSFIIKKGDKTKSVCIKMHFLTHKSKFKMRFLI